MLLLDPEARRALDAAVAGAWPDEAVGVLGGVAAGGAPPHVSAFVPVAAAVRGRDHFAVAAGEFARAEAQLRAAGLCWLGFCHSHPDGAAAPSMRDRAELWRSCIQMIAATNGPRVVAIAAFRIDAGGAVHPLRIRASGAREVLR
jgi:proteasome lid subunit RPN8/RPN11